MERAKVVRGLRIAWSVWWGILCVFLIVWWLHSYRFHGALNSRFPNVTPFRVQSLEGRLEIVVLRRHNWQISSAGISDLSKPVNESYISRQKKKWPPDFSIQQDSSKLIVGVPFFCPVAVAAAFTAAPWIRLRFGLRTLLIATTLIAVVLGLVVWVMQN